MSEQGKVSQQGSGFICPECGSKTKVYHTSPHILKSEQHRYRKCIGCGLKFYTIEIIERIITK